MHYAPGLIAAAVLCILAGPAASATQELRMLRDSLSVIRDASALRSLERERTRGAAAPSARIEQGFIALRLFEVSGDRDALKRARRAFEDAVKADAADGWAQYGLGLSLARSPEARSIYEGGSRGRIVIDDVARGILGRDVPSRAVRALAAAARAEPPIPDAAAELAALALDLMNRDAIDAAREPLRDLYRRGTATPTDLLALAAIESASGDQAAALAAADAALGAGADRSLALHGRAAALLRTDGREADGERAWLDGVANLSVEGERRYWDDIVHIASDAEKKAWQSGDSTRRRELLSKFWDVRAALGGLRSYERLAEHYRRLATANTQYRRVVRYGAPERNELRWLPAQRRSRFDDRGEIYVRHGEPARIIRGLNGMSGHETWLYVLPDGTRQIFPFLVYRGNYTLPHSLPCDEDLLQSMSGLDPELGVFSLRCDPMRVANYSANMREVFFDALESDTEFIEFTRDIPFLYDLYTFRGREHKTTVVAAFAVPAKSLNPIEQNGRVFYRLDVSLILADTALGTVSRTDDSTRIARAERLRDRDMLRTHIEVEMPPSASTLQRVIVSDPSEPGVGQLYHGPFRIPDYSGDKLMLSDIALAEPGPQGHWKRGNVRLSLVPTNEFRGGSFNVFYEIYNLPAGTNFTTEVHIQRTRPSTGDRIRELFGGNQGEIRFRFAGQSTADETGTMQELRRVDAGLGPGDYRLSITVRNLATGEEATTTRRFSIPK